MGMTVTSHKRHVRVLLEKRIVSECESLNISCLAHLLTKEAPQISRVSLQGDAASHVGNLSAVCVRLCVRALARAGARAPYCRKSLTNAS